MTTTITLHGHQLPQGWTVETDAKKEAVYITRANDSDGWGGVVTIDFQQRKFNGGRCEPVIRSKGSMYSRSGWKKRIVRDACEWLEKTMTA